MKTWKSIGGNKHQGDVLEGNNDFDVIDCIECGFAHIVPIPTEHELKNIYMHEYYNDTKSNYIDDYIEDIKWHDINSSRLYDVFEENTQKKVKRILDIGSGPGLFLKHGKKRGWDIQGIEPSIKAYEYSSKELGVKNIFNGFFNKETYRNFGTFDVVNLSLVLEHIPNPIEMVALAKSILNKDGLISVSVPNDFNPFQIALQEELNYSPWWVAPPHHINYFNHESLLTFLERLEFKTIHQEGSFPIDIFLLMGDNYIDNNKLGRAVHEKRKNFDINMSNSEIGKKIYKAFSKLGIGRETILIAKK